MFNGNLIQENNNLYGTFYDKMNAWLEVSSVVSRVIESARKKAGIVFDSDN